MKIDFIIEADIQIPLDLYGEAAELFLNHLKKYCEEQLLIDGNSLVLSESRYANKNIQLGLDCPLNPFGKTCPVNRRKQRVDGSGVQVHRTSPLNTLPRKTNQ